MADLITLQEYKAYAGISSTNQDAAINNLIPKVVQLVKSICRRSFTDYVDDFKVDVSKGGSNKLILSETPLLAISSVEFSDDFGKTYTELTEFENWVVDIDTDSIELISYPYIDYRKVNAFRVTYNAGYESIPQDLKLAIVDLITYYLRNEPSIHSNKAVGANTVQIEYLTTSSLPAHIRRVLDLYTSIYS